MSFTKLYLTTNAPLFTPTNFRGTWNDSAGAVTRALAPQKIRGGFIASVARGKVSSDPTGDIALYRGVSQPLSAQTISGTINVMLGVNENGTAVNCVYHVHVYATVGDSDTVRGTLLNDFIGTLANEWSVTPQGLALDSAQSLSSLGISAGDRIVVEIGFQAQTTGTGVGTMRYGTQHSVGGEEVDDLTAANTNVDGLAGFIVFSNAIDEPITSDRVSQHVVEAVNDGTNEARHSQFLVEAVNDGTDEVRHSQFVLEVVSPNIDDDFVNVFVCS